MSNESLGSIFGGAIDIKLKSDVIEKADRYEVVADIPGVDKEDIKVDYEGGTLQISATRDEIKDHSDKDGNILQSERNYGSLERSYDLPNVNPEKISAKYKNGVLHITLPKAEVAKKSAIKIED